MGEARWGYFTLFSIKTKNNLLKTLLNRFFLRCRKFNVMKNILMFMIFFSSFLALHAQSNLIIVDGKEIKTKGLVQVFINVVKFKYAEGGTEKLKATDFNTLEVYTNKGHFKKYQSFKTKDIPVFASFGRESVIFKKFNKEDCYNLWVLPGNHSQTSIWYNNVDDSTLKVAKKANMKESCD